VLYISITIAAVSVVHYIYLTLNFDDSNVILLAITMFSPLSLSLARVDASESIFNLFCVSSSFSSYILLRIIFYVLVLQASLTFSAGIA